MRIAQLMSARSKRKRRRAKKEREKRFIAKQMCRLHGPMQFDNNSLDPDPDTDPDPDLPDQSPTPRLPGFQAWTSLHFSLVHFTCNRLETDRLCWSHTVPIAHLTYARLRVIFITISTIEGNARAGGGRGGLIQIACFLYGAHITESVVGQIRRLLELGLQAHSQFKVFAKKNTRRPLESVLSIKT